MKTPRFHRAWLGSLILSLGSSALQAQEATPTPQPAEERPSPQAGAPEGVRAERIRQRIRDLHAAGKHEEANQIVERMKQAHMKMVQRPKEASKPDATTDKVRREKAESKDRSAHARHPERNGPPHPMGQAPVMKIRNLKMAADLLDAAGYRDHAGKARQEAGRIEGEMRKAAEMKKREDEKRGAEEAKRREMGKRKADEMKNRPDPAGGMREEIQKLRREVEELRGQLKQARPETESRPDRGRREENRPR